MVKLPQTIVESSKYPSLSRLQRLGPGHELVTTVIQLIRRRVRAAEANLDATLRDVRTVWLSAVFLILQHAETVPTTVEEQCLHSMNLAALLFICASMENDHRWTKGLPKILARRLRRSLKPGSLIFMLGGNYLPELLWMLFIGAATDMIHGDRPNSESWFVPRLEGVRRLLQCSTRSDFQEHLHCIVWDETFGADLLCDWWPDTGSRMSHQPGSMDLESTFERGIIEHNCMI
jgi:hypothetical protein